MAKTPENFMGSGWLLNLARGLSQQTLPPSFMMIHWKILKNRETENRADKVNFGIFG